MPKYSLILQYESLAIGQKIINNLVYLNCRDCLSAELVGHTSNPYIRTGEHLLLCTSGFVDDVVIRDWTLWNE